jgi:hypothetical protein
MLRHVRTAPAQSLRQSDTRQTTNGRQDTARHARQAIDEDTVLELLFVRVDFA